MEKRPFITGWCNPTSLPWQHARCVGSCAGITCTCTCHTQQTVEQRIADALFEDWERAIRECVVASPREHCERLAKAVCSVLKVTS